MKRLRIILSPILISFVLFSCTSKITLDSYVSGIRYRDSETRTGWGKEVYNEPTLLKIEIDESEGIITIPTPQKQIFKIKKVINKKTETNGDLYYLWECVDGTGRKCQIGYCTDYVESGAWLNVHYFSPEEVLYTYY